MADPDVSSAEWFKAEYVYLASAAECVISAAAAALLWAGPDSQGVLAEVGAADPHDMATSRMSARSHAEYVRGLPDFVGYERALAENAGEPGFNCVLAAFPMWMLPRWAARVSAAAGEARAATREHGVSVLVPGSVGWAHFVRAYALLAIERWGVEPVSLDAVAEAAGMMENLCQMADRAR